MQREVAGVSPDSTAKEAVVVMAKQGMDALPVVDADNRLVGCVSQQSIAIRGSVGDKPVDELHVRDAIATNVASLSVADTVADALLRMVQSRATWLPVVTRDRRLVGVLALSEIVARAASPRDSHGAWLEVGYRPALRTA